MLEGVRILFKQLDSVLIMDKTTQYNFVSAYPSVVFPPEYVLVVPKDTMHEEQEVYNAACALKRKLCVGALFGPWSCSVFRMCKQT
jgi:hypothetical protein